MQTRFRAISLAVLVVVLSGANGAVVYFVTDRGLRVGISLLLLVPIVWVGSRLGVVEHLRNLVGPRAYVRRYNQMRNLVGELLDEIRRLNWTAVDGKSGVRGEEETIELMDSLEDSLKALVGRIRDAAGEDDLEEELSEEGSSEEASSEDAPDNEASSEEAPENEDAQAVDA